MKVAQYEVLGNDAKRHVRPARDDRNVRLWVSHPSQRLPVLVDRPIRDGYLFKNANPALRTGLLSSGPYGTDFHRISNDLCNPDCDLLYSRACEAAGAFSALFSDRQFPNRITDADGARNDDLGIETT
jgi:hypothetical protein